MREFTTTEYFGRRPPLDDGRRELLGSLTEMAKDPEMIATAQALDIDLSDIGGWRVRELSNAIMRIEAATEPDRPRLKLDSFAEFEILESHPGFDVLERELMDEEQNLLNAITKARASSPAASTVSRLERPDWFWELAVAVNAAFKGLLGSQGESGHICARTEAVAVELSVEDGWEAVSRVIAGSLPPDLQSGDVVVVADKVVAASLGRFGPKEVIIDPDPKTVPRERLSGLAEKWSKALGFEVDPVHLLLADEYGNDRSVLGADDHNRRSSELAAAILEVTGVHVDVVISDTDTGIDTQTFLIGTLTIAATPLGATAGVTVYEAMRCAVAAEFTRGHTRRIPVVRCVPADRRRGRARIGLARSYPGVIDAFREGGLGYE